MNEVIAYSIASAAEDGGEMAAMDVEYKKLLLQVMIRQQLQGQKDFPMTRGTGAGKYY